MGGERLIELDEAPRIEAELSAGLGAPSEAEAVAKALCSATVGCRVHGRLQPTLPLYRNGQRPKG